MIGLPSSSWLLLSILYLALPFSCCLPYSSVRWTRLNIARLGMALTTPSLGSPEHPMDGVIPTSQPQVIRNKIAHNVRVASAACIVNGAFTASAAASSLSSTSSTLDNGFKPFQVGEFLLNPIGFGCWSWGNEFLFSYDPKNDGELRRMYEFVRKQPNTWFDTAEVYGKDHRSENLLGEFGSSLKSEEKPLIFTKCAPQPQRIGREVMYNAGRESAKRLGVDKLDMLQLHWPPSPALWQEEKYIQGMADLVKKKEATQMAVSNYGPEGIRRVTNIAKENGVNICTNQVQNSLLEQNLLQKGLVDVCKELGVQPMAYSPLALGLLTDRYNEDYLPRGARSILFREYLPSMRPLLGVMREIAKNRNKSVSQVAINWNLCKGFLCLVGAHTVEQCEENLGGASFRLTQAEVDEMDRKAALAKKFIANPQEGV